MKIKLRKYTFVHTKNTKLRNRYKTSHFHSTIQTHCPAYPPIEIFSLSCRTYFQSLLTLHIFTLNTTALVHCSNFDSTFRIRYQTFCFLLLLTFIYFGHPMYLRYSVYLSLQSLNFLNNWPSLLYSLLSTICPM